MQNVEPAALDSIMEYVYTPDSLAISEENVQVRGSPAPPRAPPSLPPPSRPPVCVQALLAGASLLQVGGVRDACCEFLRGALAPDNALGIRAFADLHACKELARDAHHYIDAHFVDVSVSAPPAPLAPPLAALTAALCAGAGHGGVHRARGGAAGAAARQRPHRGN